MCFSKGIGAPAGSVLVGDQHFVERARHLRKTLGGGMRQSGVLAAAALYALEHVNGNMQADHRHAIALANGIDMLDIGLHCAVPMTNIVIVDTGKADAETLVDSWSVS